MRGNIRIKIFAKMTSTGRQWPEFSECRDIIVSKRENFENHTPVPRLEIRGPGLREKQEHGESLAQHETRNMHEEDQI